MFKKIASIVVGACTAIVGLVSSAFAAFTLPELPVTNLESAGTAVAALIAVAVVIGVVFRLLKKA
jgi:hypothetical protein